MHNVNKPAWIFALGALLYVFTAGDLFCQQYWLRQNSPSTKLLTKCFFTDSLYGWVIGDSGNICFTSNSGDNWLLQPSGITEYRLEDIYFLNRNSGWILSNDYQFNGTAILKTTNGGVNWQISYFPDTALVFSSIHFLNQQTGFIGGFEKIYKTTNSGVNWFVTSFDTSSCFPILKKNDFVFADAMTGFACGGIFDFQGIIWKTTDGGLNWKSSCLSPEPMQKIIYLGNGKFIAMGGDYEFGAMQLQTTNSGASWVYENVACIGVCTGFAFRTPSEVWGALSFTGYFAVNLDSLKPFTPWQCFTTPDNEYIYDVAFATSTKGWCVGSNGSIFKYNTAVIGINGNPNTTIKNFELHQNFPNPFNPSTVIKYSLSVSSNVKILLYDVSGRLVKEFDEGFKPAGQFELRFEAANLASGVYYYSLYIDEQFFNSKKMVLLK
jgi:photosystem II stability/assembly factor-like uncharacterized protein